MGQDPAQRKPPSTLAPVVDPLPGEFELSVEHVGGVVVVALAGEADLYAAPAFKQELFEQLGHGASCVLVDFSRASLIDSTILGALVGALKRLRRQGGDLAVIDAPANILSVFAVTGLDRVFRVYRSRKQALTELA